MMLELSPEECDILKQLVEREIEETGPEIHHTRNPAYHERLKAYKAILQELHAHLSPPDPR